MLIPRFLSTYSQVSTDCQDNNLPLTWGEAIWARFMLGALSRMVFLRALIHSHFQEQHIFDHCGLFCDISCHACSSSRARAPVVLRSSEGIRVPKNPKPQALDRKASMQRRRSGESLSSCAATPGPEYHHASDVGCFGFRVFEG